MEEKDSENINSDKQLFLNYKNEIINEFGREGLDTDQCNKIGRKYLKHSWGGCLPWNKVHLRSNRYYIVNTSSSGHPGIHWMALIITRGTAYLWDSYNRSVKKLVPHLVHSIIKHGYKLGIINHPMEQIGHSSQVCGHESLAFLLTVKKIGIHRASKI